MPFLPASLRARAHALPREARDTPFLLAVIAGVLAPQAMHLPAWTSLGAASLLAWRGWLAWRGRALPGRWLLAGLLALAVGATWLQFRSVVGRDAGVVLLVLLLALKTLELRARRDAMVVFFLGFFVVLTLFFHSQSLPTALAMGLALWGLLAGVVHAHLGTTGRPPLAHALRMAGLLLLGAAPLAWALFLLFPRMAPLWGLPQDLGRGRTGLSGAMAVGQVAALALDDSVALRVRFGTRDGLPPTRAQLYFRGPVLTDFDGRTWQASAPWQTWAAPQRPGAPLPDAQAQGPALAYEVTLEPHRQHWLLTLDAALQAPRLPHGQARATPQLQWLAPRPVLDVLRYQASSHASYRYGQHLSPAERQAATRLPAGSNPRTAQWAQQLRAAHGGDTAAILAAVLRRLGSGGYRYTLEPGPSQAETADDFWFDSQRGFCEHMASALAVLMRQLDVPARIVTGYQGGERNPLDGLWTVRQSDAHAWTEIWLAGQGWVRVDPTAAVAPGRVGQLQRLAAPATVWGGMVGTMVGPNLLQQIRAAWEALNHRWNEGVLHYTTGPQRQMLDALSRLLGAIIEANHDDRGIIWPEGVTPFHVGIVNLKQGDNSTDSACEAIYAELRARGLDPLYDDRDERAGAKFASMDLIGLPWRITVGPRGLAANKIELTNRRTGLSEEMSPQEAVARLEQIYRPVLDAAAPTA